VGEGRVTAPDGVTRPTLRRLPFCIRPEDPILNGSPGSLWESGAGGSVPTAPPSTNVCNS
jgi:hypothetical protein